MGLYGSPCLHQPAEGTRRHPPVIDGQKLLADSLGNRVKACAGAAGKDDAFHGISIIYRQKTRIEKDGEVSGVRLSDSSQNWHYCMSP